MKKNEVKFTVAKGGEISFEVIGGQGQSCTSVTKEIELQLSAAGTITSEGKKPEYYEQGPDVSVFNSFGG